MTPLGLCSNVVYCYTYPCDTSLTYLGMSSRHLVTRAKEYLDLNQSRKSAVKDHILDCGKCSKSSHSLCSNVGYCYTYSCDTSLTYLGMSSRHLFTRAKEHLDLNQSRKSAVKDHILDCGKCSIHCTVWLRSKAFETVKTSMTQKFIKHSLLKNSN